MKNRIFHAVFLSLMHLCCWAQIGGDYNPSNPSDPGTPTQKYTLTLNATPSDGGSFNTTSTKVSVGERYNLRAYPNSDFEFVAWICNNDTLSKSASYDYVMPSHNVKITGVFAYNPSSPSDPQEPVLKYQLSLVAEPMNSGSFNFSNERLAVGSSNSLYAYTNTDFVFKHWKIGDKIVSTDQRFEFIMPSHDVQMTGVFEYNPESPANPNRNYWNKLAGEVIVDDFTPGNLSSAVSTAINGSNSEDVTMITVAGKMNDNDFGIANNYTNCTLLDLSRVTGITQIPSYAFDYTNIESVYLPATIEAIGYGAFYDCRQLQALTIYAMTPPALERDVFKNVPDGLVVYVPAAAIAQYQDADDWKNFTLLPIQEDIRSISVSLPDDADAADYAKMWLELTNIKSGQRMHYVMTNRTSYTFMNIIRNTSWNVTLRNERGDVFGQIDNVDVKDEDVSVAFTSLAKPQNVNISIITPGGKDVTEQTQVTWTDKAGNYLAQSYSFKGLLPETELAYRVTLSQELAVQYSTPALTEYMVSANGNDVKCQLEAIKPVQLTGKVKDVTTKSALSGAIVSASQTFGGKYGKTVSTKTDVNGNYTLTVSNVPTSLAIAASDYISQSVVCDTLMTGAETVVVPEVSLKPITGAVISLGFTYTSSVAADDETNTQNWYGDYNNVAYTIYNKTKQQSISQFNVQYPQIVLLEEVEEGDVLELTATSKTSAFMPVTTTATIDAEQRAGVTFDIVELGKIQASFAKNGNAAVVGSLYDANGKLLKSYDYSDALLTISNLADGKYTLVSMGSSRLFNTIYDISQLPQTGLVLGSDYAQNAVDVKSGVVSVIEIDEVPTLDESKLYYTGDNTSFTVNKSSIVAGNYLTLTGHLDFKSAYATSVSNVNLIVDLPESCSFVENSVMVGNSTSSYTLNGTRLTIPMARYTDRVRFCIIPTLGGEYAPSAFAQFDLNGETVMQPIGSANYTAKDLSISVPSTVAKTTIPISGTAIGTSNIEIYDNDVLIGQTTSMANGTWATTCELNEPYNLSRHQIYAKVTTKAGISLTSEIQSCTYNKDDISVKTVDMTFYNAWMRKNISVTFDLENQTCSANSYSFYHETDFTFLVDFTKNDTTSISNVKLYVFTSDNNHVTLYPTYDEKLDRYVAVRKFYSEALPQNVNVSFDITTKSKIDISQSFDDEIELIDGITKNAISLNDQIQISLLEDHDSLTVFKASIPNTDFNRIYKIKILDFQEAKKQLSSKQFDFEISEGGYRYYLFESNKNEDILTLIDTGEEVAYIFILTDIYSSNMNRKVMAKKASTNFLSRSENLKYLKEVFKEGGWIGVGSNIWSGFNDFLGLNKYSSAPSFNQYFDIMDAYLSEMETKGQILSKALIKKCADGTYRLSDEKRAKYASQIMGYDSNIGLIYNTFISYTELYKSKLACSAAIDVFMTLGTAGLGELSSMAANGIVNSGRVLTNSKNTKYFKKWITNPSARGYLENTLGVGFGMIIGKISEIINPEEADFQGVENEMNQWMVEQRNNMQQLYNAILQNIKGDYRKCKTPQDDDNNDDNPPIPSTPNVPPILDPSGYVYEGISSNRLEGVTATCYYKETVEDMYGDLHENIVKWDAAEYAQENPLFTDENGMYRWDVPQGLWQVKFEKEGYETTYSEWLPVPPPQLEVNIAMKQNAQPNVKNARAYEDAVEIEFDKYMMPELLNTENITVMANDKNVEGTIELLNEEVSYEGETETFASKVRFNAAKAFDATEVTVMVNNRVKSYAGIRMQDNYQQDFTIEQEIRQIVSDSLTVVGYGESSTLVVQVLPESASKGKMLTVKTSSPMILEVETEQVTIDNDGKAEIMVFGELPGTAALTFSVEGTDKTALTIASVEQTAIKTVATPTANIASGTVVDKGTAIVLSCATEGATIYYTLDGSCPCDDTDARKVYDGTPIIINEDMTIKAMAAAPDMYESEVAEFSYFVNVTGIDEVTRNTLIEILPLPVREKLNVTAGGKIINNVVLSTINGIVVAKSSNAAAKVTLDVNRIPIGIYIINVTTENGVFSRKIQKVR